MRGTAASAARAYTSAGNGIGLAEDRFSIAACRASPGKANAVPPGVCGSPFIISHPDDAARKKHRAISDIAAMP